ncbi:hypothetical protein [Corynebacterium ulceribovis]|uniref:hypothetical protein n=1 Tax=Corynebacterium ulceribovis TaxID=487732 RepID=UPI00036515B4|nr:hypothetical protein [Corynebacterium ulceribovis]
MSNNNPISNEDREEWKAKKEAADAKAKEAQKERDASGNFAEDPDKLADEWQDESFGTSDPPSNY